MLTEWALKYTQNERQRIVKSDETMCKMKTLPCHLHKKDTTQDAISRDQY